MNLQKHIFACAFFIFFVQILLAQNIVTFNGVVLSSEDSTPVSYVSVKIKGKDIWTITNRDGSFSISGQLAQSDSIIFTHLAYHSNVICYNDFLSGNHKVLLEPQIFILDEITAKANGIVNVLEKAVNHSVDQLKSTLYLKTYYREFVKENQGYTKFSEGLLNYFMEKKGNEFDTKLWVDKCRTFSISKEGENTIEWGLNSPLDVCKMPDLFALNRAKSIIENSEKYIFELKTESNNSGGISEILYKPKGDNTMPLFSGKFVLDKSKQYILLFQSELEQDESKPSPVKNILIIKGQITMFSSYILFDLNGIDYNPLFSSVRLGMKVWNKKKINETFEFYSDLQVKQATTTQSFPNSNQHEYRKKALFPFGNNYNENFWEKNNTLQLTGEELKIIESLNNKQ